MQSAPCLLFSGSCFFLLCFTLDIFMLLVVPVILPSTPSKSHAPTSNGFPLAVGLSPFAAVREFLTFLMP